MGKADGFLLYKRQLPSERKVSDRILDFKEIYEDTTTEKVQEQAARCMDCGVPFCHKGCPLGNVIPEFNDAVYNGDFELAADVLLETNNFPEFTGRICPAPCEGSCVLGINKPQVAIEFIEKSIAEIGFEKGYIVAKPPTSRSGKKVAVIGSGPAGLAAADQLNQSGHSVTVFERDDRIGGLLRYGIPDFKLEKWVLDRRLDLMVKEGIEFNTNANVGDNIDASELLETYDAMVLCGGSTIARDLPIPGRNAEGIHFAMDFLTAQNRIIAGDNPKSVDPILALDKHVIVIGGGDTGSDCVGTSIRNNAASVTQIELMPQPPLQRSEDNPWPEWPMTLRTSSSQDEGCDREWAILTEEFITDDKGQLQALRITEIEWVQEDGNRTFKRVEGTTRDIPCDLALLAMGFVSPQKEGLLEKLSISVDEKGNVKDEEFKTNHDKIFVAGDMRRGQSLVVWAIAEGRMAAEKINKFLSVES